MTTGTCCTHAAADHEPDDGSTRPVGCQIADCDCRSAAAGPVEQCDSMNAHLPHGRCPGARGAFTGEFSDADGAQ